MKALIGERVVPLVTDDDMVEHFEVLIPGATSAGRVEVHSPYDRSVIDTIGTADSDDMERALASADGVSRDRSRWKSPAAFPPGSQVDYMC